MAKLYRIKILQVTGAMVYISVFILQDFQVVLQESAMFFKTLVFGLKFTHYITYYLHAWGLE